MAASRPGSLTPMDYDEKRETSSTTSSTSALARNSTAATSITSQPATSLGDRQSTTTAATSVASTPNVERTVTRTRRLYEQGLNQDLQEQQSSAMSRIDTLSRQRTFGNRTPDLAGGQNSPSPTATAFERFSSDRRAILSKASAPNLRSMSPPTTGSSIGTTELDSRVSTQTESKTSFGGSPPLSPPISEGGESPFLPIQPNDRGKATAMGVFQKPSKPYDESRFAQRQLQLQQGRETPTQQRLRTESNASLATDRSKSSCSVGRPSDSQADQSVKTEPKRPEKASGGTFLDDGDDGPLTAPPKTGLPPIPTSRPSDRDHPAFRQSSAPSPLSMSSMPSQETLPIMEQPELSAPTSRQISPADSPTLGPNAGLSGMVRQHLRSDSNTSSNYGAGDEEGLLSGGLDSQFALDSHSSIVDGMGSKFNPWMSSGLGRDSIAPSAAGGVADRRDTVVEKRNTTTSDARAQPEPSPREEAENEPDEFASQLANARRRVRERLTSYVESDASSQGSPTLPQPEFTKDSSNLPSPSLQPQPNPPTSAPGLLKPKSSRGSLADRSRTAGSPQTKGMKLLGLGGATMSSSPSPSRQSFEDMDKEPPTLATMEEDPIAESPYEELDIVFQTEASADTKPPSREGQESAVNPGLRAFRQAKRELQRGKERETFARHDPDSPTYQRPETAPSRERRTAQSPPQGGDQILQPTVFSEPPRPGRGGNASSSSSRQASTERNRNRPEANHGQQPNGPPPRSRGNSNARDDPQRHLRPTGGPRPPMLRSPGLPGTDIRRSPIMPPQPYPGSNNGSPMPSPNRVDRSNTAGQRNRTNNGNPPRGRSSPNSPYEGPNGMLNESMRKAVKKGDISEPTFVMSTSRVPTVNLPQSASGEEPGSSRSRSGSRSRSNSNNAGANAPPLPPINPRRKWDGSRAKGVFGSLMGRKDGVDDAPLSPGDAPPPPGPSTQLGAKSSVGELRSAFSGSDDEDTRPDYRRRLRKTTGGNRNGASRERSANPPFVTAGPPASRAVISPRTQPPNNGFPGGMI